MIRLLLLVTCLFSSLAQASLYEAQERIYLYIKAPERTADLNSEELVELGQLKILLKELNKDDYRKAIGFLKKNWNINATNSQRLFIELQKQWQSEVGKNIAMSNMSKRYVDGQVGLAAGTAALMVNYSHLLRPLLGLPGPMKLLTFVWTSGAPIAATYGASTIMHDIFRTNEAVEFMKTAPESPAAIIGFPMVRMDENGEPTLDRYELEQLYALSKSLGVTGVTHYLLSMQKVATALEAAGGTAARVMLVFSLVAATGYVADIGLEAAAQNNRFAQLAGDLKNSVDQIKNIKPENAQAQLIAQNIYAKTINLMQFELLPYLKATRENGPVLNSLKAKVEKNLCENPKDGAWDSGWYKDSDEADLYLAIKDIRDGLLTSMRDEGCQSQVDQYIKLSLKHEKDPENVSAKKALVNFNNYLARRFSEGNFCGGFMQGHPLHLLLSASIFLEQFGSAVTWPQIEALNAKFAELAQTRFEALNLNLESAHEAKIRRGELPDPAWSIRRKKWVQDRIKQPR